MLLTQAVQVANVVAGALGRDGGVLPGGPTGVLAGNLAVAHSSFADLPNLLDLGLVLVEL
jgi:hypothetical protein